MKELLSLLKQNARLSNADLAAMLGRSEETVAAQIAEMEEQGVIRGYSVIVDEELADRDAVTAYIELKITPQPDCGFDELARTISGFSAVESVISASRSPAPACAILRALSHSALRRWTACSRPERISC